MATAAASPPSGPGLRLAPGHRCCRRLPWRLAAASAMKDGPMISKNGGKEEVTTRLSLSLSNQAPMVSGLVHPPEPSNLRFDRLRPSIDECKHKRLFGRYVAREAMLDEEYWIAAWLRAENHYEEQSNARYVESFKRKFAAQEFHALKKQCGKQLAEKCICIVAVKNDSIKRTVLNSVVGTLDICVRHPLHGEKYPAEPGKASFHCRIYQSDQPRFGYFSNVCVAKYARRQGIASNMLFLAIDSAKLYGAEKIYIHVHKDNVAAQKLYDHIGFKMVDLDATLQSSELCLLSLDS